VVSRILLAVVVLVLAANVTPREFGLLSVPLFLSTVLMVINDVGFGQALIYQRDRIAQAAETATLITIVTGVVMGTALLVCATALANFLRVPDAAPLIRAYAGIIAINGFTVVPLMRLNRALAFRQRFVLETLPQMAGAVLTIVLAIRGVGVWSLVVGDAARYLMTLTLIFARPTYRVWPRWHAPLARGLWPYARWATLASGLDIVLLNVDYALVARLLGPVALGYYSLAFRVAILPFFTVTMVVVGAGWPALSRLREETDRLQSAFRASVRTAMGGVLLMTGGLIVVAPSLELISPRWGPAVTAARLLAVFVALRSCAYLLQAFFQSTGHPGVNAVLNGIWAALLAGLIALVGRAGVEAVAATQVGVAAVLLALHVAQARRSGVDVAGFASDVGRPALTAILACATVLGGQDLLGRTGRVSWLSSVVIGVVYAVLYLGLLRLVAPPVWDDVRAFRARFLRARPVPS
jgi:O-antigen/teichoic acid export membrane protein